MKKLLSLFICFAFVIGALAVTLKDKKVPAAAKTSFAVKFPSAQKVKWSVEKPGEFEVEFTLNKVETSALLDAKGTVLETETEIKESELPRTVKDALAKDFAGYKLSKIEKVTDQKGVITFEMEEIKGKDKRETSFDMTGKVIKP
jgi:hypothetical protein